MLKKIVQNTLSTFGYEIRRTSKSSANRSMPVELNLAEREIVNYIMSNKLTMVSYERLWATIMACKYVVDRGIEGDFVECGVWRGGNALAAAEIFRLYKSERKVWLFDTFKGMTAPTDVDVRASDGRAAKEQYEDEQRGGHNEWCFASIEDVRRNFHDRGLASNVNFIEGDVCQTLNGDESSLPNKISVLRLDTDWYESTKKELEVLYPRLTIGGCLLVDDYGHWSGSRRAVDEYFLKNQSRPFLHCIDYTGRVAVKVS